MSKEEGKLLRWSFFGNPRQPAFRKLYCEINKSKVLSTNNFAAAILHPAFQRTILLLRFSILPFSIQVLAETLKLLVKKLESVQLANTGRQLKVDTVFVHKAGLQWLGS